MDVGARMACPSGKFLTLTLTLILTLTRLVPRLSPPARLALATLIALGAATLFVRLGLWQLHRLGERRARNALVRTRLTAPPQSVASLPRDPELARYRRVRPPSGAGTAFDYAHEVALAGRTRDGSPGVHILTPLAASGTDTVVFVDRGWVYAADGATVDFSHWHETDGPASGAAWEGYALDIPPTGEGRRGDVSYAGRASVVRWLDRDDLRRRVGQPVAPVYVMLLADSGAAMPASTPVRATPPALDEGPHLSYAVQWFSFAALALLGLVVAVQKERRAKGPARQ
jgi:surfeit locus 1 family protein